MSIVYTIWDRREDVADNRVRSYLGDLIEIDRILLGDRLIGVDARLNSLVDAAHQSGASHLCVTRTGHAVLSRFRFDKALASFCAENQFLIAGHILMNPGEHPRLHNQMFVLNLREHDRLGRPKVHQPAPDKVRLRGAYRSSENVHDDYTPLWIKPSGTMDHVDHPRFGWSIIEASLAAGIPVINLPGDLRDEKVYLYPEENPAPLSASLEEISDGLSPDTQHLNWDRKRYIDAIVRARTAPVYPFVMNTEPLDEPSLAGKGPFKRIFGVASGFKSFVLWDKYGADDAEIVWLDRWDEPLSLWHNLVNGWDGKNLEGYLLATHGAEMTREELIFGRGRDLASLRDGLGAMYETVGGEVRFQDRWQSFRALRHRFVKCDLLGDRLGLGDLRNGDLVWYSNVFRFAPTLRELGGDKIRSRYSDFIRTTASIAPQAVLVGVNPDGLPNADQATVLATNL